MSNLENIFCSKCRCKTDKALMLSCEHNLCMNCAAKYLSHGYQKYLNDKQYIACEICGSKTEIDAETSREILLTVLNNLNINPNYINGNNNNSYAMNPINYPNNINYNSCNNFFPNLNSNILNYRDLCKEHGEPISYLCLDCMSKCICSECILNGIHTNHEVTNIKKAYPLICEKTLDLKKYTSEKINELNCIKNNLEYKRNNIGNINQKCKNEIRNAFQLIRIRLNDKEKEILEKAESALKENLNEINTYINIIQGKMITLSKIINTLNANLTKKDELNLINFYCDNKNYILSEIEINELNSMSKINSISDLKINVDKKSFDNMLQALNDLEFEINTCKNINYKNNLDKNNFNIDKKKVYGIKYKNRISSENPMNLNLTSYDNNNGFGRKFKNKSFKSLRSELPKKMNKSFNKGDKKRSISVKRINNNQKARKLK